MTKYFLVLLLGGFFISSQSHAKAIHLIPDQAPFFQCGKEALTFLGGALGNQLKYKGDRRVIAIQTFFFADHVYTAILLDALPPDYFQETWLVKSDRTGAKCVPTEAAINADNDIFGGGGGISVHN